MPQILKPSNLSLTWASAGDVLDPGNTKYATGWQVEIPPRQWFNYLDNRQDTAIAHINQHGVAVWDAGTEYQANKSYCQGKSNGTIYRCVQTHTNQDPELDVGNVYWIVAFASAGDFYTKAEVDGAFLSKAANGSDILNAATFRNNISVYSQTQTYTKTEVDTKTTVASTTQSQAWSSNTTLITPLRLAEAFKAANQATATCGFQKLPGGIIVQWGLITTNGSSTASAAFPIPFPTACFQVVGGHDSAETSSTVGYVYGFSFNSTTLTVGARALTGATTLIGIRWIAIGY